MKRLYFSPFGVESCNHLRARCGQRVRTRPHKHGVVDDHVGIDCRRVHGQRDGLQRRRDTSRKERRQDGRRTTCQRRVVQIDTRAADRVHKLRGFGRGWAGRVPHEPEGTDRVESFSPSGRAARDPVLLRFRVRSRSSGGGLSQHALRRVEGQLDVAQCRTRKAYVPHFFATFICRMSASRRAPAATRPSTVPKIHPAMRALLPNARPSPKPATSPVVTPTMIGG